MTSKIPNTTTDVANSSKIADGHAPDDEPGHQVLIRTWARGSSASRMPSPTTLMLSTVSTSMAPGIRQ